MMILIESITHDHMHSLSQMLERLFWLMKTIDYYEKIEDDEHAIKITMPYNQGMEEQA